MEIFKNKFLVKLIASLCIFFTLLNLGFTSTVRAEEEQQIWGGKLLWPIIQLFRSIGDGVNNIVQSAVLGGNVTTLIKLEGQETTDAWWKVVLVTVIAVVAVVAVVASGGAALAAIGAVKVGAAFIIKTVATAAVAGLIAGTYTSTLAKAKWFPDDIYLPIYKVTAQEIFSNQVSLFDVNFFSPNNPYKDFAVRTEEVLGTIKGDYKPKIFNNNQDHSASGGGTDLPGDYKGLDLTISQKLAPNNSGSWSNYSMLEMNRLYAQESRYGILKTITDNLNERLKQDFNLDRNYIDTSDESKFSLAFAYVQADKKYGHYIHFKDPEGISFIKIHINVSTKGDGDYEMIASAAQDDYYKPKIFNNNQDDSSSGDGWELPGDYKGLDTLISGNLAPDNVGTFKRYSMLEMENLAKNNSAYNILLTIKNNLNERLSSDSKDIYIDNNWSFDFAYIGNEGNYVHYIRFVDPQANHVIGIDIRMYKDGGEKYDMRASAIQPNSYTLGTFTTVNRQASESMAQKLQGVVAQWYFTLRNIALLVLMLILIYSGIRIVIASTAGEKAKYKERIVDWIVAICLVMVMHYIMVFATELVEKIIELVSTGTGETIFYTVPLDENGDWEKSIRSYGDLGGSYYKLTHFIQELDIDGDGDGEKVIHWPTNLMGKMRIEAQMSEEGTAKWVGHSISFLVLVCYTLFFAWTYLRRVVYMAFLTMISPLVAMTYPIDKITDGKAQAFNAWLKEYIFNLMIQPMHLLLYNILISSALDLANENALYTIVAVGFLTPAEKLMRKFFGFEKAKTPGLLSGAAGSALAMSGAQALMRKGHESNDSRETDDDSDKIKWSSSNGVSPMDEVIDDSTYTPQNIRTNNTNVTANTNTSNISNISNNGDNSELAEQIFESQYGDSSPAPIRTSGVLTAAEQAQKKKKEAEEQQRREAEAARIMLQQQREQKERLLAENKKKPKNDNFLKASLRAGGAAIGSYRRGMQNKVYKRIQNGRPVRALARGALGITGGTLFGLMGLVAGIASGDPSKAFQYTTAGLTGGFGLGKRLGGSVVDTLSVDEKEMRDEIELAWYGENYKKFKLQQEEEQLIENEDYIRYIRKTMGVSRKEAIGILEDTGVLCLRSGINNIEDIATVHKLTEELAKERILDLTELKDGKIEELTQEAQKQIHEEMLRTSIAMKKFSDRLPTDISKMSESKIRAYQRQFRKEIKERIEKELMKRGLTKEAASLQAESAADKPSEEIISGIIRFSNTKSDLTQI